MDLIKAAPVNTFDAVLLARRRKGGAEVSVTRRDGTCRVYQVGLARLASLKQLSVRLMPTRRRTAGWIAVSSTTAKRDVFIGLAHWGARHTPRSQQRGGLPFSGEIDPFTPSAEFGFGDTTALVGLAFSRAGRRSQPEADRPATSSAISTLGGFSHSAPENPRGAAASPATPAHPALPDGEGSPPSPGRPLTVQPDEPAAAQPALPPAFQSPQAADSARLPEEGV